MARWSAADMPCLAGRVAVVTGASSGLGLETVKALAEHRATVVMACRDDGRCAEAAARIRGTVPDALLEPMHLDLADLDSVSGFAEQFAARHDRLDILVNNAGVMAPPTRFTTKQGFELQFGTNHLGHFALTGLLLSGLFRAPSTRVVTVSSFAHKAGEIRFEDLQSTSNYSGYQAYSASKLANLLFALKLDRSLREVGSSVMSVAAHPGFAHTNLQAAGPFMGSVPLSSRIVLAGVRLSRQSAEKGARPQLFAATDPGVQPGFYYGSGIGNLGRVVRASRSSKAKDLEAAERLWHVSAELTGVDIDAIIAAEYGAR